MKKTVGLIVFLHACLLALTPPLFAIAPPNFSRGFLVEQYFPIIDADWDTDYTQGRLSDWEVDSKAGTVDYLYWSYLKIDDTSTSAGMEFRKPFLPQSSGTITTEFRIRVPDAVTAPNGIDGMTWAIRADRDNSLVEIQTAGGNFGYIDFHGTFQSLGAYAAGTEYTIHVDLDLPGTHGSISINGVSLVSNAVIGKNTTLTEASQFYMSTPAVGTIADLRLYYVTITKGYRLLERFTNAYVAVDPLNPTGPLIGPLPSPWTSTAAGGTTNLQIPHGSNAKDMISLLLHDTSTSANCVANRPVTTTSNKLIWEYKFKQAVKFAGLNAQLRSGATNAVTITTTATDIAYLNGSGTAVSLWADYKSNLWYTIRVVADPATDTADIYVNGKKKATGAPFNAAVASFSNVQFSTSNSGTGDAWVDDIYLYDFQAEPADYVPAVQPVTIGAKKVGMQTFFAGWREGSQLGWDWPYRFPNHDPLLGFFDGGNREAMDWQLKWMAEAGVTFFLDCWYKTGDGQGFWPIKEPFPETAADGGPLHNGYFYAKYSDKVKFAIADYSMYNVSAADFESNILPYWMEYYFKDDRYYVIPGAHKGYPVIAFGKSLEWLAKDKDPTAMKDSITKLRAALVAEGFDGAYVLAVYPYSDATIMTNLYNAGVDFCYAYWGTNNVSTMETKLVNQRNYTATALEPIANTGQGYSGEAWDIALSGAGYTTIPDFTTMSVWMRDTFPPTLTSPIASSHVLYDNWNEFGEGHYICPTNLAGFNYLDVIRSTYTTAGSVTNQLPTEAQKGRFNTLYTRGWEGRQWVFDAFYTDTEGWTALGATVTQNKGYLEGTSTGSDPQLFSRDGYAIDAAKFKRIKIRMNNPTTGAMARLLFITNTDASYNVAKSVAFNLPTSTSAYSEYILDMGAVAGWTGTIRQLRFDPIDVGAASGQTFSIDYIKVLAEEGWEFNGATTEGWAVKVQITGLGVSGGYLNGTIAGSDPSIWSADNLGLNADMLRRVKIRMKNSTAGTAAKLYFITNADTTYNEAKAVSVNIVPSDPGYTEYVFDMRANANWMGTLRRLRFDAVDAGATTGNFSIDYIRLTQ